MTRGTLVNPLSAHLLETEGHDRLAFHPACPRCRDRRAAGSVGGQPLMPTAVRAGVAAALIGTTALSAGAGTATAVPTKVSERTRSLEKAPPMVSPEQLDKSLADPNKAGPKARGGPAEHGSRMVHPGDSLWSIARSRLGGDPSNARVAAEVTRIWNLNAKAIGTGNPNLILPGQRLKV